MNSLNGQPHHLIKLLFRQLVSRFSGSLLSGSLLFASVLALTQVVQTEASHHAVSKVSFASNPWPPLFLNHDSGFAREGLGFDLISEIFSQIPEAEPSFPIVPWKRALREVELGAKDGIGLLLKTQERQDFLAFSLPVMEVPWPLFYNSKFHPEGIEWHSFSDLNLLNIAIVDDYSYGPEFDALIEGGTLNLTVVSTLEKAMRLLQHGRVDLVPGSQHVMQAIAGEQGWQQQLSNTTQVINMHALRIGIAKTSPAVTLLPQINQAIRELTKRGKIDEILASSGARSVKFAQLESSE